MDFRLTFRERFVRLRTRRKQIHAVAQNPAAGFLQRPPQSHAQRGVARRQAQDECGELAHCLLYISQKSDDKTAKRLTGPRWPPYVETKLVSSRNVGA